MSKTSKSEAKKRRAANKRATRAANQLRYQSYAGKESNKKKKTHAHGNSGAGKHTHPNGACGNIACLKCSSVARVAKVKLLALTSGPKYAIRVAERYGIPAV